MSDFHWRPPERRLIYSLALAATLHLLIIFGIGIHLPAPTRINKTLEITLATMDSHKAPKNADYLAQLNQQGSGSLKEKALPTTTQRAPFQDNQVHQVSPPRQPPPSAAPPTPHKVLTSQSKSRQAVASPAREQKVPDQEQAKLPVFDQARLSAEISSLEAQLAEEAQRQARRPRKYTISSATTMRDKGAWYKEDWRKKIERVGNLNYPAAARAQGIYGSLRLLVSINRDGSLHNVQVLASSGQPILDRAAQRIVRLAAPFSPLTGDLAGLDQLEIIRTWRFERGDRLSSN